MNLPLATFPRPGRVRHRWRRLWAVWFALKARYRAFRTTGAVTRMLGPQYSRALDRMEIDVTYDCNLRCMNCNRSSRQAPDKTLILTAKDIARFVDTSLAVGKRWRSIRVLGGEPTLHPEILPILAELLRYREFHGAVSIELVTNGFGEGVNRVLERMPSGIRIENSQKTSVVQPHFGPFNMAPVDDPAFSGRDFSNGCVIAESCGTGLTPMGYYPCAVAGGIDRIVGLGLGRGELPPDSDEMRDLMSTFCRLCGRFRDGHFVPLNLRPALENEEMSPSWKAAYEAWRRLRHGS